jgi:multidrug efflux pump subunit AcrB
MRQLNLSEWALRHQSMVLYLMIVFMVGGVISFLKLGRAEDPDFTFKVMVVRTLWPGASAAQVEQQLTERIEKKLAETPWVDVLRTASKPGESLTIVILKDYTPKTEVPEAWRQVRKKLDDIRHTCRPACRALPQRRVRRRADQDLRPRRTRRQDRLHHGRPASRGRRWRANCAA